MFFEAMVARYMIRTIYTKKYYCDPTISNVEIMSIIILFHDSAIASRSRKRCKYLHLLFQRLFVDEITVCYQVEKQHEKSVVRCFHKNRDINI